MLLTILLGALVTGAIWIAYNFVLQPLSSPLRNLPGPPAKGWIGFGGHLNRVLKYVDQVDLFRVQI